MDAIIAVIWVVIMVVAAIKAVAKKAKQQQEMQARESAGEGTEAKSRPIYTAPEEDVRTFLEQIGAKPPLPAQPRPQQPQPQPVRQTQLPQPQQPKPRKSSAAKKAVWPDTQIGSDVPVVPKVTTAADTVTALTGRLSPIQRAVVWREILDPPPGLRTGMFAREV